MGAISAILGEAGDPELGERLQRMLGRSPHRGAPEHFVQGPLAIGVQHLGSDASLAEVEYLIVAFHGFIGNWPELAGERGWRFADGVSNAKKIAEAYEDLGEGLFGRLRGEWALLIWNKRDRTLLAARDVAGCRPLHSHRHDQRLFLATEVRQALAGSGADPLCDAGAAADQLLYRFPENGRTIFRGVSILPGGVLRIFPGAGTATGHRDVPYWSPPRVSRKRRAGDHLDEELRWLLERAVARATPVSGAAVSLSGGMDSSTIWATLASLAGKEGLPSGRFLPYSNVYPGMECDETPFIQSIHDHTGVEGVLVDTSRVSARDHLDALCADIDRPHLPNALAFRLVSQAAAADGHSTIFTGVGGDEWLGGSLSYIRELFYSGRLVTALGDLWRVQIPARDDGFINRLSWLSPGIGLSRLFGRRRRSVRPMRGIVRPEHLAGTGPIRGSWRERTAGQGISSSKMDMIGSFDRLVAGSVLEILEGQAAQFGVEVRYPLMDLDLIEFGFSLESRALVEGRCHKSLLRRTMEDRLPADVTGRIETTVFAVLSTREFEGLGQLPAGADWDLSRLGTVRASAIDACLAEPYSESTRCDLIWLWWLESFVRRRFRQDIQVGSIRVEEDDDGGQ